MTKFYTLILYLLVTVGLAGYVLPWIVAPSAALTLNAYDLAEWTSLHPLQRQTSPPLLAPLELRLQLVIFTVTLRYAGFRAIATSDFRDPHCFAGVCTTAAI